MGRRRTKVDWDVQPFGEISDADIARAVGSSLPTVGRHRKARGIPRYRVPPDGWKAVTIRVRLEDAEILKKGAKNLTQAVTAIVRGEAERRRRR